MRNVVNHALSEPLFKWSAQNMKSWTKFKFDRQLIRFFFHFVALEEK